MKHSLNIVRKELDKIFRNPRLIFSTFLMPGLMIFLIYSFMGSTISNQIKDANEHLSIIEVINAPDSFKGIINNYMSIESSDYYSALNAEFRDIDEASIAVSHQIYAKDLIEQEKIDALLYFEEDFDLLVDNYINKLSEEAPQIIIYTNSSITNSSIALSKIQLLVSMLNEEKLRDAGIDPNISLSIPYELADPEDSSGQMIAMMLPMLITVFVFAGGLSIGADAIAGEKERGTIATLLMAPISKSQIVAGKIFSTIIITILSALGSFAGVLASLPNAKDLFGDVGSINFGYMQYIQIFIIIILIALVASSFFLIASTLAKSTKEATMYAMPVYMVSMVISYLPMFTQKMPTNIGPYLIPIYNLIMGLKGILLNDLSAINYLAIIGSTAIYTVLLLSFVRLLFNNEKLMFQK